MALPERWAQDLTFPIASAVQYVAFVALPTQLASPAVSPAEPHWAQPNHLPVEIAAM